MEDIKGVRDRAPLERAAKTLYDRVVDWIAESPSRSMNGLAHDVGYLSPNGLRKALKAENGPHLKVLLHLAGVLGYRSIEELFGDFGTTSAIEELRLSHHDSHSTG